MKSVCPIRQINYDDEETMSKKRGWPFVQDQPGGHDVTVLVWRWRLENTLLQLLAVGGGGVGEGQVVERMSLEIHATRWFPLWFVFRKHQHY